MKLFYLCLLLLLLIFFIKENTASKSLSYYTGTGTGTDVAAWSLNLSSVVDSARVIKYDSKYFIYVDEREKFMLAGKGTYVNSTYKSFPYEFFFPQSIVNYYGTVIFPSHISFFDANATKFSELEYYYRFYVMTDYYAYNTVERYFTNSKIVGSGMFFVNANSNTLPYSIVRFKGSCLIKDSIDAYPCKHGGTCSMNITIGQHNCICTNYWTGDTCEERLTLSHLDSTFSLKPSDLSYSTKLLYLDSHFFIYNPDNSAWSITQRAYHENLGFFFASQRLFW
jgi:hypothetical protein